MAFPPLGNSDHVAVSVFIDFRSISRWDALFHCIAYYYSRADWDRLRDHLRDVPWEDIFKLSTSAAASEFCEWVQVGIDVYIPHRKCQVKPHSSPWFSAACAAVVVHRNHFFFVCTNRKNLLNLKTSSARLIISVKGFLKLPNLHMLIKLNSLSLPRNFALGNFGELLIVFSTKVNLFNGPELLSPASDKRKFFAKNFSKNSNLDNSGISLPVFSSRTNLNMANISVTPKIVRKVIAKLDSS